jgi:hypothetical protein
MSHDADVGFAWSGRRAIRGKLMHYVFRDMFGKVKSYR